ncbi:MAG: hypothetical protein WKF47_04840 [Geodermatophilaceae bacterium]
MAVASQSGVPGTQTASGHPGGTFCALTTSIVTRRTDAPAISAPDAVIQRLADLRDPDR